LPPRPSSRSRAYPKHPVVGVGAVVWKDDKVLLVRRAKPPRLGRWSLPGGRQKLGETLRQAVRREIFEETGIKAAIGPLIANVESIQRDPLGAIRYHWLLADFTAEWRKGALKPGSDAMAARWFAWREIAGLRLWAKTRRVIEASRRLRRARDRQQCLRPVIIL
jgi:ADP-ribose pyrophosphatase YjhB (NUDIX family)